MRCQTGTAPLEGHGEAQEKILGSHTVATPDVLAPRRLRQEEVKFEALS
jgi:hypothetical protein